MNKRRALVIVCRLLAASLPCPFPICIAQSAAESAHGKREAVLDVVVFNYIDRPIYDVHLNDRVVGHSASLSRTPLGKNSVVARVAIPFGLQSLTWRDAISGRRFADRTPIRFDEEHLAPNSRYLGLHIYPDGTGELSASEHFP
ncbi:MAG: hypothetical protein ABUU24_05605, partial [Variovorax sp.]